MIKSETKSKDPNVVAIMDRIYSTLRTSKIGKTAEEKEAICDLSTSLGIASGFVKDAHQHLTDYQGVCNDLMALHPQILALLPRALVMEVNRLNAVSQAWKRHAESEAFSARVVDFDGAPEEISEDDMGDLLQMAQAREEEHVLKKPEKADQDNVVSLFK